MHINDVDQSNNQTIINEENNLIFRVIKPLFSRSEEKIAIRRQQNKNISPTVENNLTNSSEQSNNMPSDLNDMIKLPQNNGIGFQEAPPTYNTYFNQLSKNNVTEISEAIKNADDSLKLNFKIEIKSINRYLSNKKSIESYDMVCINDDGEYKSIRLSSIELNKEAWITSNLGCKFFFTGNYKRDFKPMFKKLLQNANIKLLSNCTGWHELEGGIYRYFHASGTIPEMNNTGLAAYGPEEYDFNKNSYMASPKNVTESFFETLNIAKQEHYEITLPLLLYQPLAILKEFFKLAGYEPKFCLFLIGKSGSGKTTIAELFACMFNRINSKVDCNFNDTIASIEVIANTLKDSIMIVDDFYPNIGKEKSEQNYKLERINRMYGDGKGKSRTNKYLKTTNELSGKGMCLITGELESENLSTQVRYLGINIDNDSIDFSVVSKYQKNKLEYNDFFYFFIRWLSENSNRIISYIQSEFDRIRNSCNNELYSSHKRMSTITTFFIMTRIILTDYVVNVLPPEHDIIKFLKEKADNYILSAVRLHSLNTLRTTPELLFIEGLNELLATQVLKIFKTNSSISNTTTVHGYKDDNCYYLLPETVRNAVYEFWEKRGKSISYTKNTLYKKLADLNVIKTSDVNGSKRNTINYRFNGKTARYLVINKAVFEQLLNSIEIR